MKGCVTFMLNFVSMREVCGIYFTPEVEAILIP